MFNLKRKEYIAHDGERFSLLVDYDGIPDFWITLFMTTVVRQYTHSTQRAYVNHLYHYILWEARTKLRLSERISVAIESSNNKELHFFASSEIQSLAEHCKLKTKVARRLINSRNKVTQFQKPTFKSNLATVSVAQQNQRLKVIAEYFEFVAHNYLRSKNDFHKYINSIEATKSWILTKKVRGGSKKRASIDPDSKAPPPEVFAKVMDLVKPDNPKNPFTSLVKNRNFLMFRILYETGLRSGEILQLKISDIKFSQNIIEIRRRHDDPQDIYRPIEPNAKTLERDIFITDVLADELRTYITQERRTVTNANKHDFLFVSYKGRSVGKPISLIQFSRIVEKIADDEYLAEFIKEYGLKVSKKVTRHGFRHDFNNRLSNSIDRFNQKAKEEGRLNDIISEKKELERRMYLMGHKSESSSQIYNLRHTKKQAETILLEEMQKLDFILHSKEDDS